MKLSFVFYHIGTPIDGRAIDNKPLGGTESVIIYAARELARRGHAVSVFTRVEVGGDYDGVKYYDFCEFENYASMHPIDVFICVRHLLPLLAKRWAPVQIYHSPDAYDQPFVNQAMTMHFSDNRNDYEIGLFSLRHVHPYLDAVACVGAWQAETFIRRFLLPREKVVIFPNGVDIQLFLPQLSLHKRTRSLVYTSTPYRGLEYLLRWFPEIRRHVPDATCDILSGMQVYGVSAAQDHRDFYEIYQLANQPGVTLHGPLLKKDMAHIMRKSRVMAYPNTFAETFCIAVLEGQAAGLPTVTSQQAALVERIVDKHDGSLIVGLPHMDTYRDAFIQATVQLLVDDALWNQYSENAYETAKAFDYSAVVDQWESQCQSLYTKNRGIVCDHCFLPDALSRDVLVNGYPKHVALSAEMIRKYYVQALTQLGLLSCARKVLEHA